MGRPVKIHKKKSFMFTTKHTSFQGVLGIVIAALTIGITVTLLMFSFHQAGEVEIKQGATGFFVPLLNIIGLISGILSLGERDVYITPGIIAIVANALMIILWTLLVFIAL